MTRKIKLRNRFDDLLFVRELRANQNNKIYTFIVKNCGKTVENSFESLQKTREELRARKKTFPH